MKIFISDDNGSILYQSEFTYNQCVLRGRLMEVKNYGKVNRSALMVSQGKDKDGEWRPSAFAELVDFEGFLNGHEKGDTVHLVLQFAQDEYNGKKRVEFVVRGVIGEERQEEYDL